MGIGETYKLDYKEQNTYFLDEYSPDSNLAARLRYGARFESFLVPQRRGFSVEYPLEMGTVKLDHIVYFLLLLCVGGRAEG